MDQAGRLFLFVTPILLAFMALEHHLGRRRGLSLYAPRELGANLAVFGGLQLSKALLAGWAALLYAAAGGLSPWSMSETAGVFAATFFVTDLVYYWQHRLMHELSGLWALHEVHHSSPWFNLSTSLRISWLSPLVSPLFQLPLIALGFPARFVALSFVLNLLIQFFVHTELIDRVPLLEGVLNTPEAHRVHHASNEACLDKNYGGVLMIWDRLFGTWATPPADEPLRYGVTTGFRGHNPLKLVFGAPVEWVTGRLSSKG